MTKSKMKQAKKSIFLAICFYLFLSVLLPSIWFKDGLMKAGGESGLPLYSPERTFRLFRFAWQEIGIGTNSPTSVPGALFYLTTSVLIDKLGVSPAFFQAALFAFLLFSSACSMFYLSLLLAQDFKERILISFLAGLFYLLNPFVVIDVWCRFLYPFMFFLPLLPLTLALFVHGLRGRRIRFIFFFSLASFIFSYTFTSPPLVMTLWMAVGFYFLFYLLATRKEPRSFIFAVKFFLITAGFWVLTNLWWLVLLFTGRGFFSTMTVAANLASLRGVSKFLTLEFVSRMQKSWFLFETEIWGSGYKTPLFQLISWMAPLIVGLTVIKKWKAPIVCFFGFLAILAIFLAKGTSPPFGEAFAWLFTRSFFFGALRNPFEKLGLLLAVSYSFLFGIGLGEFWGWANKHSLKVKVAAGLLLFLICFLTMGVYLWPAWTGKMFGTIDTKITVKVPEYYQEANQWLNNQSGDFRVLSLPSHFSDGVIYNWPAGYQGGEASFYLFDRPVVASILRISHVDEVFRAFLKNFSSKQAWKVMGLLNAKYILVNDDIDYRKLNCDSPEVVRKTLEFITRPSPLGSEDKPLTKVCNAISYRGNFSEGRLILPICKIPGEKRDWSQETFLRIKVKSERPVLFEVDLLDRNYIRPRWTGQVDEEYVLDANQWRYFIIPLRSPTESSAEFNYHDLRYLSVILHKDDRSARIDGPEGVSIFDSVGVELGEIYLDRGVSQKTEKLHFERSFDQLDFYKIDDDFFVPKIYATNQFFVTDDVYSMFNKIEENTFVPGRSLFFLRSQEKINKFTGLGLLQNEVFYQPKTSFRKIDPTKYDVRVEDVDQPFFLVFSETYHPSWELRINGKKAGHFLVNGYANGYYINKTGDLNLKLEFFPQRYLLQGGLVSGASMIFLIGIVVCKKFVRAEH